ncbi:stage V sporulation protein AE [Tumebacillus flagellatus]|uniref:Stage V sporulation protein AE n=1 Tax=Tumebacillus flagellatus TaxID=1157490 RepID=A0A074LTF4_9BACL|nr:stage V sporulation protein AE [Tumebacillus flagellatus]KEO84339.1 stage V sporulation protein AE [Tumebacillus flagellatus]
MAQNQGTGKRKVIVVTDGDQVARRAVEEAASQVGCRVISRSSGNPTPLDGEQIVRLVQHAKHDPVVVMFDDNGNGDFGYGEQAIQYLTQHPEIEVLGAVAVASNTPFVEGVHVDLSIDQNLRVIEDGVDKDGIPVKNGEGVVYGDTVDVLSECDIPIIVGVGDIGKMQGKDHFMKGAPVTKAAFLEILKRSGYEHAADSH